MSKTYSNANTSGSSYSCKKGRALVTFRMVLPTDITAQAVHLKGSWDNFSTALPMEQDVRVGRGVWKGMITEKGGLEMGCDYTYYFLLDSKISLLDPSSTPELITVDPTSGRQVSMLYVPLQLPPSPQKPPTPPNLYLPTQSPMTPTALLDEKEKTISQVNVIGSSVFAGSGGEGKSFEEPRKVPEHPPIPSPIDAGLPSKESGSLRGLLRGRTIRRASIFQLGTDKDAPNSTEEAVTKRRKWTLVRKASGIFRGRSKVRTGEGDTLPEVDRLDKSKVMVGIEREALPNKQVPPPASMKNSNKISDIVGYLRDTSPQLAINKSECPQQQPAQAYYHSPVTSNHSFSVSNRQKPQQSPPSLPPPSQASASGASKTSSDTTETSPSLYHSVASACSCHASSTCSCTPDIPSAFSPGESSVSDGEGEGEEDFCEVDTPIDCPGTSASLYSRKSCPTQQEDPQTRAYPKYYNFDELSAGVPGGNRDIGRYAGDVILREVNARGYGLDQGGMKSLECLREEVAGELAWRAELVDELGYLGRVVL